MLLSSLLKKYVMAISGAVLFVFVVLHMLGNLQIFLGPTQINAYGHFLQSTPELLWTARIGLLVMVVLHVWTAVLLSRENRAARPARYREVKFVAASYASRTMLMSGVIVFVFIVYHLLHFTVAVPSVNFLPQSADFPNANFMELKDPLGHHDIYRMMVMGYSNVWVSGFYILGMALLCLHLSHGVGSMFQSLGLKNKFYGVWIDRFAVFISTVIFVGNCSIPLSVLLGLVK